MIIRTATATAVVLITVLAPAAAASVAPGVDPPGANDFSCRPSPAQPAPVVLVHGTRSDMTINWQYLAPALARDGYCVFALDLEDRGQVPIERSADRLGRFVRRVLAATDASKVSFVGHSLGGVVARQHVRFGRGGVATSDDVISLSSPHQGFQSEPPFDEVDRLFNTGCPACDQQAAGSAFLRRLNGGNPTPPPVSFTQLQTAYDEIVTPPESAFLPAAANVANVLLQDACPAHFVEHLGMAGDALVLQWIRDALGRPGPADEHRPVDCGVQGVPIPQLAPTG